MYATEEEEAYKRIQRGRRLAKKRTYVFQKNIR